MSTHDERVGRHLAVAIDSPLYPPLLARLDDAPPVLFVDGDVAVLGEPQLAIVGSRNPTAAGRDTAFDFAAELARAGLTITSGLAAGIDTAAHEGALAAGGRTVAVCGTGLDITYPPANQALARRIAAAGAVVSEFPAGTPPRPENFPRRNRVLSGLALGVLVIEAAQRSGSLITARLAGEQGREVFAVPGSIHNPLARGCHRLIRDGAKLVESVADVLAELSPLAAAAGAAPPPQASDSARDSGRALDSEYEMLLNALGFEPVDVDTLVARTGYAASSVCSMLLILELRGEVESRAGGRCCRRAPGRSA
jgi:DNA processing protein